MKVEYAMPDHYADEINRLNGVISVICQNYLDGIGLHSTKAEVNDVVRRIDIDPTVRSCQGRILEIYTRAVPTIIVTAENKDEIEAIRD